MSADRDVLIRTAKQLMAMRIAMLHTMETLRREMEKRDAVWSGTPPAEAKVSTGGP